MDKKFLRIAYVGERLLSFIIDYIVIFLSIGASLAILTLIDESLGWISLIVGTVFLLLKDIF
ncbi:hypothetical protein OXPF_09990 [Oxobacter pfennigii]|uniref:Uncharacterized protein n=1 Tax=Oxobacter pfennigii TaxID=36849 RepID=A0A0P9AK73_9CLOT|nr:hypothetical protein [Oxobacter pfennigii]KPU45765.1 hypothetical protein OXPF_09990 [Oxobacter pfennigii]